MRLISEVPLGIFLSGGLDSSSILAAMSRISGSDRVKSFSVGYEASRQEEEEANEFNYARQAAAAFNADHHEFRLSAGDFGDFIPKLVWYLDEPLADPTCIPLYFISRLAKNYVTVILSGEGADETLAGYNIYQRMLALDSIYSRLPSLVSWLAPKLARFGPGEGVRHYLRLLGLPLQSRYRSVTRGFRPELKRQLFNTNGGQKTEEKFDSVFTSYFDSVPHASPLEQMLYVDIKTWLPDDLLLKADKMTMANAQELRVPFLDHKLVEFAASLPAELKIQGGFGKVILRRSVDGVVPESIIRRVKKGFPVPTNPWLRYNLKELSRDAILGHGSACRKYLDGRVLERVIGDHESGRVSRHQEIWTLLIFEYWHRVFIDRSASSPESSVSGALDPRRRLMYPKDRVLG
jgi:asparagine synthase (glutamine-hydrolysing)